jgi:predicted transcriptional regulator
MGDKCKVLPGCTILPPIDAKPPPMKDSPEPPQPRKGRKETRDRFTVLNQFVDFTMVNLPKNDVAVWLILYRDTRNGEAKTGQSDIARRAGISKRTVKRAVKRLELRGLITVVRRGGLNRGVTSYRVHPLDGAS